MCRTLRISPAALRVLRSCALSSSRAGASAVGSTARRWSLVAHAIHHPRRSPPPPSSHLHVLRPLSGTGLDDRSRRAFATMQQPQQQQQQQQQQEQAGPSPSVSFAQDTDPAHAQPELDALLDAQWALDAHARGISKTFYFKTFTKVLDFVNLVGIRCKSARHHPVMTVEFGSVHIYWTTHEPPGLSAKDLSMARYCEEQAVIVGAVAREDGAKCS